METSTIFYSWQSEDKKTKNFIDKALKGAIKDIENEGKFSIPLTLDRDTKDVIGSPHIVKTILSKIDACDVFVADVSIIDTSSSGKKLVNQNVMFELGYAIAKHTELKVITLFNQDMGSVRDIPFDISHHRAHTFSLDGDKKGVQLRKDLHDILLKHLLADKDPTIIGHEENLYAKLRKDVVNFLLSDEPTTNNMHYEQNILDENEKLIMRVFGSMQDEKRILVSRTLDGGVLIPYGSADQELWGTLSNMSSQEIIADMDSLVDRNILTVTYSQKGTPSYMPTKEGFKVIKDL